MTILQELKKEFKNAETFTLNDAYENIKSTERAHSIRARIYEGIDKGIFKRVSKGVFTMVSKDDNSVLLVQGSGRDLSMIADSSIDCIITDHPYSDKKSNKGGNRNFAEYNVFQYNEEDFIQKARVLKDGAFLVEFFAEENSNNYDYIYNCKKLAEKAGLEYYSTVNWKKGNFVSNTGRKAKNTEQMVFFTKGKARNLKLDAKKNKKTAIDNGLDVSKLDSYETADLLKANGLPVARMSGTAKMLPTEFDIEKTPKNETIHQAEKPVELFMELLDYISLENELVLDQFAGSCNLGAACLRTKRNALLFELDIKTYKNGREKLEKEGMVIC